MSEADRDSLPNETGGAVGPIPSVAVVPPMEEARGLARETVDALMERHKFDPNFAGLVFRDRLGLTGKEQSKDRKTWGQIIKLPPNNLSHYFDGTVRWKVDYPQNLQEALIKLELLNGCDEFKFTSDPKSWIPFLKVAKAAALQRPVETFPVDEPIESVPPQKPVGSIPPEQPAKPVETNKSDEGDQPHNPIGVIAAPIDGAAGPAPWADTQKKRRQLWTQKKNALLTALAMATCIVASIGIVAWRFAAAPAPTQAPLTPLETRLPAPETTNQDNPPRAVLPSGTGLFLQLPSDHEITIRIAKAFVDRDLGPDPQPGSVSGSTRPAEPADAGLAAILKRARDGDRAGAEADLRQYHAQRNRKEADAERTFAVLAQEAEDYPKAIEHLLNAVRLNATVDDQNTLGNLYHRSGDYRSAYAAYDAAIKLDPAVPGPHHNLANVQLLSGQYELAIEGYRTAISLVKKGDAKKSELYLYYTGLGNAYLFAQRHRSALEAYDTAIAMAPAYDAAYVGRGDVFRAKGLFQPALADFNKAVELNRDNPFPLVGRAVILFAQGRYDAAATAFDAVIAAAPSMRRAYISRGWAHLLNHNLAAARKDFEQAIAMDTARPNADALVGRGLTMIYEPGDAAEKDLIAALSIDNGNAYAHAALATAKLAVEEFDGAIRELDIAIKLDPQFAADALYAQRALAFLRAGDAKAALEATVEPLRLTPENGVLLITRGLAFSGLKQFDQAAGEFRKAGSPSQSPAIRALARFETFVVRSAGKPPGREEIDEGLSYADDLLAAARDNKEPQAIASAMQLKAIILAGMRGDTGQAEQLFAAAIATYDKASTYQIRAMFLLSNEQYDRAYQDFASVAKLAPGARTSFESRARTCLAAEDFRCSAIAFSNWLAYGASYEAFNGRATSFLRVGKFDRALEDYDAALKLDPAGVHAREGRAQTLRALKRDADALVEYDLLINAVPKPVADYHLQRSQIYLADARDLAKAKTEITVAIEIATAAKTNFTQGYETAAEIAYAQKDYAAAARYSAEAISQAKSINRTAWTGLVFGGRSDLILGDPDGAVKKFDAMLKVAPTDTWSHFMRGLASFIQGKFSAAAQDFEDAPRTGSAYPALWVYLASARVDKDAAVTRLREQAQALDKDKWPYQAIEMFLGQLGADAVLAATLDERTSCEGKFYVAEHHLFQQRPAEAKEIFRAVTENCDQGLEERLGAVAELARLSAVAGPASPGPATSPTK